MHRGWFHFSGSIFGSNVGAGSIVGSILRNRFHFSGSIFGSNVGAGSIVGSIAIP